MEAFNCIQPQTVVNVFKVFEHTKISLSNYLNYPLKENKNFRNSFQLDPKKS